MRAFVAVGVALSLVGCSPDNEQETQAVKQATTTAIKNAQQSAERYEYDKALRQISEQQERVENSSVNIDVYDSLLEQLKQVELELQRQQSDYSQKKRQGWSMFEGSFISPADKKSILAERKRKEEQRLAEQQRQEQLRQQQIEEQKQQEEQAAREKAKADKEAKRLQEERKAWIEKRISEGVFAKTELTGSLPKIWITQRFRLLDEKTQNQFLNVVYAYWTEEIEGFGRKSALMWDSLILKIDNGTQLGARIGSYDPVDGVKWK